MTGMTRRESFRLKNRMLFANIISNAVGVVVVLFLIQRTGLSSVLSEAQNVMRIVHMIFQPFAFIVPVILVIWYEHPIRRHINQEQRGHEVSFESLSRARRRLLNEPFVLIAIDFGMWLLAGIVYPSGLWISGAPHAVIRQPFFMSLFIGLITTAVAFFVLEHVLQRVLVPHFFPQGGLYMTPKTLRIRISTRIGALIFAANLVPFFAILNIAAGTLHSGGDATQILAELRSTLFINAILFMLVGIWLAYLVSGNLKRPLEDIIRVLQKVRNGHFDKKVRVTSNDEIGYTGDSINDMTDGLNERDLIKDTFGKYVAEEVRDEVLSGRTPLDGEKKEVTILFSDLRDFTPMTEQNDPKLVIQLMNAYFKEMAEAIKEEGGLVLQFIGDEIYAVFGAPIYREDHAVRAFRAGLKMRRRLTGLNRQFEEKGWPSLRHGIGIHTGEALAANIGSPDRLSYLLVGDTINLASRLQSLTRKAGTDMIISATTHACLDPEERKAVSLKRLENVSVKGKSKPVEAFAVL
ncbi:MAG: HAMP domain-containing protein [Deltaproteobacteria bacterium]|nr:HAMP domain-containing protein [Deltaproteobacteria bacterium]